MLNEVLSLNIYNFILVFARLGTMFILMPGIGATFVSIRIRLFLALMMSLIMMPTVSDTLPPIPIEAMDLFIILMGEIIVGAFLGTVMAILMAALHTAGTVIAFTSGLANAFSFDPISQSQGAVISSIMSNMALVLLFVTDLHHMVLEALVDSYTLFTPGARLPVEDFAFVVARKVADSFEMGVQLASPFIILSIGFQATAGVLGRLSPQIPIFFIAMPLQIIVSIILFMFTISGMMLVWLEYFQDGMIGFLAPL